MKRVFLYAYDKQNLGDDLFIQMLVHRYSHTQFYMWSNKTNKCHFSFLPNLKVYDSKSGLQLFLEKIRPSLGARRKDSLERRCDAMVYIGGSIFIEYENWPTIVTWWDYETSHRNMFVLGANFGPFKTEAYKRKMEEIFSKMKDVCFREEYSKALFSTLTNVRVAPDILYNWPMPDGAGNKKQIFVSLIDCAASDHYLGAYEEEYYQVLHQLISEATNEGYRVVVASFCKAEGDEHALAKLAQRCERNLKKYLKYCYYDGTNATDILQEISDSDFIIGTRFHASILGFAAGKPVLPIIYSDKTEHVLEDAAFKGIYLDIRQMKPCSFAELMRDSQKQKIPNIRSLREASQAQFEVLDQFLLR